MLSYHHTPSLKTFLVAFSTAALLLWSSPGVVVDAFSIHTAADTFHLVQTAATTVSHQLPHWHGGGDLLQAYKHQLAAHPLPTKMMTGAALAVAGDAIAQKKAANDNDDKYEYDTTRAMSFAVFDMAYRALQHASFPVIVAACQGQFLGGAAAAFLSGTAANAAAAAMEQTLASQLLIVPFLYYPAFFALTGAMQGLDAAGSISRAKENFLPLMQRNLLFWIPVQFVQFGFIPTDLQIPFLSCAGLVWTFILSVAAGSAKSYSSQAKDPAGKMMAVVASTKTKLTNEDDSTATTAVPTKASCKRDLVKV